MKFICVVGTKMYSILFTMQYEIEIKSLLGSKKASDNLLEKVTLHDPSTKLVSEQHQLNHYFKDSNLKNLSDRLANRLTAEQLTVLTEIDDKARHVNVRTREKNGTVLLIVKGSLDDVSAAHSHQRMEFEAPINLSIDELDAEVEASGWVVEAKWQAERKLYDTMGLTLDMFFTPGYGYMVEFEKTVEKDSDRDIAHAQLVEVMKQLGVSELPNDRLERMFKYYNEHWQEYYGTDKIFIIE